MVELEELLENRQVADPRPSLKRSATKFPLVADVEHTPLSYFWVSTLTLELMCFTLSSFFALFFLSTFSFFYFW
jgi:hypothetical protein